MPLGDTRRERRFLPSISTSTVRSFWGMFVTFHAPVQRSCISFPPKPLRWMLLSDSLMRTKSPGAAADPGDWRAMVSFTRWRARARSLCRFSKTRRTSRRYCLLVSTKLCRPSSMSVSSMRGNRESRDVRGCRPNSISKGKRFLGKDGSSKVRLTQHAGETFSSHRSGYASQSSERMSWIHPPSRSTAPWPRGCSAGPTWMSAFSHLQRCLTTSHSNSRPPSLQSTRGTRKVRQR